MRRASQENGKQEVLASDFAEVALPELPALPGMTSAAECRYLYWLTSTQFEGAGTVLEVGPWLGRSTVHLAAGLRDGGHAAKLHCFDGFTWAFGDSAKSGLALRPGQNFQPYFERNVAPFAARIVARRGKIADLTWDGGPIGLLFLDAPKRLGDIITILRVLGPHLVPGKALIACQDYLYFPAYAMAVTLHALGQRLALAQVVLDGSTVAFRVRQAIDPQDGAWPNLDLNAWSRAEVEAAWRSILAPLHPRARERLEPGRALHLYDIGARAAALEAIRALAMTPFQSDKMRSLARSHHYLSYPALFDAAGFPGSLSQRALVPVKRLRDFAKRIRRQP